MLLSDKGHVKLADFGLSRVHIERGKENLYKNLLLVGVILCLCRFKDVGSSFTRSAEQ